MPFTFPKSERLSSSKAIEALFESGRGEFVYPFRYIVIVAAPAGPAAAGAGGAGAGGEAGAGGNIKILISVSKRNHKRAVVRNLLKRRTREAWRLNKAPLMAAGANTDLHLGLIYTSKTVEEYRTIEAAVRKIVAKLCESSASSTPAATGCGERASRRAPQALAVPFSAPLPPAPPVADPTPSREP